MYCNRLYALPKDYQTQPQININNRKCISVRFVFFLMGLLVMLEVYKIMNTQYPNFSVLVTLSSIFRTRETALRPMS